jgi:hypothetical protein
MGDHALPSQPQRRALAGSGLPAGLERVGEDPARHEDALDRDVGEAGSEHRFIAWKCVPAVSTSSQVPSLWPERRRTRR